MSENMSEIKNDIEDQIRRLDEIAEMFYQQKDMEALTGLGGELPGLMTLIDEVYQYKKEHEDVVFDDAALSETLQQMMSAMEEKDYVLVADVLKYEVIEKFQAAAESV